MTKQTQYSGVSLEEMTTLARWRVGNAGPRLEDIHAEYLLELAESVTDYDGWLWEEMQRRHQARFVGASQGLRDAMRIRV